MARRKELGQLSDDEWEKHKKRKGYLRKRESRNMTKQVSIFFVIGAFVVVTVVAFANGNITEWLNAKPESQYHTVRLSESEIKETFQLRTAGKDLDLSIKIKSDAGEWIDVGEFHLEFTRITMFDGSRPSDAYVLYYPPEEWYVEVVSEKAKYEEIHIPKEKQKVGVDPTFYKGKDYPYELFPFDEVEITTNKVIKLLDTNETIYDFYVRVLETDADYNIEDIHIEYN